jgi:hypothetical protein
MNQFGLHYVYTWKYHKETLYVAILNKRRCHFFFSFTKLGNKRAVQTPGPTKEKSNKKSKGYTLSTLGRTQQGSVGGQAEASTPVTNAMLRWELIKCFLEFLRQ